MIVLKKEVIKTNNVTEHEDTDKYRQLLVRTLHSCSVRFPDMAANVIPVVSYPSLLKSIKIACLLTAVLVFGPSQWISELNIKVLLCIYIVCS